MLAMSCKPFLGMKQTNFISFCTVSPIAAPGFNTSYSSSAKSNCKQQTRDQ